jgi:hypothetical protein
MLRTGIYLLILIYAFAKEYSSSCCKPHQPRKSCFWFIREPIATEHFSSSPQDRTISLFFPREAGRLSCSAVCRCSERT